MSSSRKRKEPKSLGEVLRKVPETKNVFLSWLAQLRNQGKLEKLINGILKKDKIVRQPPRGTPPDVRERYEFTNAMIKLLKLSKIPQLEKAIRTGKDWHSVLKGVKDKNEIELYANYFQMRNSQRGGHELTYEEKQARIQELNKMGISLSMAFANAMRAGNQAEQSRILEEQLRVNNELNDLLKQIGRI